MSESVSKILVAFCNEALNYCILYDEWEMRFDELCNSTLLIFANEMNNLENIIRFNSNGNKNLHSLKICMFLKLYAEFSEILR